MVRFSWTAYLMASFKFTPELPLLPWQRNLGQIGYNSACVRDILDVFEYTHRLNDKLIDLSCSFLICIASLIHLSTLLLSLSMTTHIYDNLFAPNLSGERQLDRPFRRRLQSKLKRQH